MTHGNSRRAIIVDADLPKRLATELSCRGRAAESLSKLSLHRSEDPTVLRRLRERFGTEFFVLVTGDDQMLLEHQVHAIGIAVAVVDPWYDRDVFTSDQWRGEIVHRWAHRIFEQESGDWFRYGLRPTEWKKPRRPRPPSPASPAK